MLGGTSMLGAPLASMPTPPVRCSRRLSPTVGARDRGGTRLALALRRDLTIGAPPLLVLLSKSSAMPTVLGAPPHNAYLTRARHQTASVQSETHYLQLYF